MSEQLIRKPLGCKNYGSIGHLPQSRLGPGDHKVTDGQARICLHKERDKHDVIIVSEKLDGSNVGIARIDGQLVALGRAGYLASTSKYEQHQLFAAWVRENAWRFGKLQEGWRLVGEWLAQAHGTRYELKHEPFAPFDLMRGTERAPFVECWSLAVECELTMPKAISMGPPRSIEWAMGEIGANGFHAADSPEGAVWRVERKGKVDFLAKFVKPDKKDGTYLPEISGQDAVWNWRPK